MNDFSSERPLDFPDPIGVSLNDKECWDNFNIYTYLAGFYIDSLRPDHPIANSSQNERTSFLNLLSFGFCFETVIILIGAASLFHIIKESTMVFQRKRKELSYRKKEFQVYYILIILDTASNFISNVLSFVFLKGWRFIFSPIFLMVLGTKNYIPQCFLPFFHYFALNQIRPAVIFGPIQFYLISWLLLDNTCFYINHVLVCMGSTTEKRVKKALRLNLIFATCVTAVRGIIMFVLIFSNIPEVAFTSCKDEYKEFLQPPSVSSDYSLDLTVFSQFRFNSSFPLMMKFSTPHGMYFWFFDSCYRFSLYVYLYFARLSSREESFLKKTKEKWWKILRIYRQAIRKMQERLESTEDRIKFENFAKESYMTEFISEHASYFREHEKLKIQWKTHLQTYCALALFEILIFYLAINEIEFSDCFSRDFFNLELVNWEKLELGKRIFIIKTTLFLEMSRSLFHELIRSSLNLNAFFKSQIQVSLKGPDYQNLT